MKNKTGSKKRLFLASDAASLLVNIETAYLEVKTARRVRHYTYEVKNFKCISCSSHYSKERFPYQINGSGKIIFIHI
jgi:hypothetical protein